MTPIATAPCSDAALLATVHRETVASAYRPFFPATAVLPSVKAFEATWRQRLSELGVTVFLATVDERPGGLVAVAPSTHASGEGELVGLFVRPACWGQGVGSALHDVAIDALVARGASGAGLWVIAANTRARRFYESRRWQRVRSVEHMRYPGVAEIRYGRRLDR